jgi:hypothetical protein
MLLETALHSEANPEAVPVLLMNAKDALKQQKLVAPALPKPPTKVLSFQLKFNLLW